MNIDSSKVPSVMKTFNDYKHVDENGKEYWSSRELSKAMGYTRYQHFEPAINRAKVQMTSMGKNPEDHMKIFIKNAYAGNGASREVEDIMLDKYAAYNVAINADPSKPEVAIAQEYFLQTTAKVEEIQKRLNDKQYLINRDELRLDNIRLRDTLLTHEVKPNEIGVVLDAGDQGFFNMHTKEVKELAGINSNKPVANILGKDLTKLKDAAQILSRMNIESTNACGVDNASDIVYDCNKLMRDTIIEKANKTPEELIPYEDVKKVEKRYDKETEKLLKELEETDF